MDFYVKNKNKQRRNACKIENPKSLARPPFRFNWYRRREPISQKPVALSMQRSRRKIRSENFARGRR